MAKQAEGRTQAQAQDSNGAPLDEVAVDALFAHMEELVDVLPSMEEKGRRLLEDEAARAAIKAERYWAGQIKELDYLRGLFEEHSRLREEALAAHDAQAEERERYSALRFGNQIGIKNGAEAAARQDLDRALKAGGFADADDARARILPDEERAALKAETDAFQEDYRTTLEACQSALEAQEAAGSQ